MNVIKPFLGIGDFKTDIFHGELKMLQSIFFLYTYYIGESKNETEATKSLPITSTKPV